MNNFSKRPWKWPRRILSFPGYLIRKKGRVRFRTPSPSEASNSTERRQKCLDRCTKDLLESRRNIRPKKPLVPLVPYDTRFSASRIPHVILQSNFKEDSLNGDLPRLLLSKPYFCKSSNLQLSKLPPFSCPNSDESLDNGQLIFRKRLSLSEVGNEGNAPPDKPASAIRRTLPQVFYGQNLPMNMQLPDKNHPPNQIQALSIQVHPSRKFKYDQDALFQIQDPVPSKRPLTDATVEETAKEFMTKKERRSKNEKNN